MMRVVMWHDVFVMWHDVRDTALVDSVPSGINRNQPEGH